jgi:hypothetical protein
MVLLKAFLIQPTKSNRLVTRANYVHILHTKPVRVFTGHVLADTALPTPTEYCVQQMHFSSVPDTRFVRMFCLRCFC